MRPSSSLEEPLSSVPQDLAQINASIVTFFLDSPEERFDPNLFWAVSSVVFLCAAPSGADI